MEVHQGVFQEIFRDGQDSAAKAVCVAWCVSEVCQKVMMGEGPANGRDVKKEERGIAPRSLISSFSGLGEYPFWPYQADIRLYCVVSWSVSSPAGRRKRPGSLTTGPGAHDSFAVS